VNVYQDNIFGSLMFQDPNAPGIPSPYALTSNSSPSPSSDFVNALKQKLPLILQAAAVGRKPCSPWPSCTYPGQSGNTACSGASKTAPTVTSVSPNVGPAKGGFIVLLKGTGFCGATSVTAGGWKATSFTVVSDTEVRAVLPGLPSTTKIPASGYSVDVAVCTAAGCSPQYVPGNFNYLPQ
jgi:hypothetical protein